MSWQDTERDKAVAWLRKYLADGPHPAKEVELAALSRGFSWATVLRAKKDAGAQSHRGVLTQEQSFYAAGNPLPRLLHLRIVGFNEIRLQHEFLIGG